MIKCFAFCSKFLLSRVNFFSSFCHVIHVMDTPRIEEDAASSSSIPLVAPSKLAVSFDADQLNNADMQLTSMLPQLWMSRVQGWFAQAEAQFSAKGITALLTKYFYVLQALPEKTLDRLPALRTNSNLTSMPSRQTAKSTWLPGQNTASTIRSFAPRLALQHPCWVVYLSWKGAG